MLRSIPKLQSDGLEILKVLSRDHIDAIRVNAVESIIFQVYDKRTFSSIVWPLLKPLFEDPSWRVRLACILQIGDVNYFLIRFVNLLALRTQKDSFCLTMPNL